MSGLERPLTSGTLSPDFSLSAQIGGWIFLFVSDLFLTVDLLGFCKNSDLGTELNFHCYPESVFISLH